MDGPQRQPIGLIIGALNRLVVPGKQHIPIWLTPGLRRRRRVLGTLLAAALGVDDTGGIDWIKLALQVASAIGDVAIAAAVVG